VGLEISDAEVDVNPSLLQVGALKEIRFVSTGLVLPEFEMQTLQEGISRIAAIHEQRTGLRIHKELFDLPADVEKSVKISLYRMVQEGLNNAFRHAPVSRVTIRARFDGKKLQVDVADTGAGFDPKAPGKTISGLGLPGLRKRIESIGGSFEVNSKLGEGTTLTAQFAVGKQQWGATNV
jgi:signal transduction histidine kinase